MCTLSVVLLQYCRPRDSNYKDNTRRLALKASRGDIKITLHCMLPRLHLHFQLHPLLLLLFMIPIISVWRQIDSNKMSSQAMKANPQHWNMFNQQLTLGIPFSLSFYLALQSQSYHDQSSDLQNRPFLSTNSVSLTLSILS